MHGRPASTVREVVEETGRSPDQVVKAMVLEDDQAGLIVALLRGSKRLDPRAVSDFTGTRVTIMRPERVEAATGCPMGAVSPLSLLGLVARVVVDEGIRQLDRVSISSGDPRMSLELAVTDLMRLVPEENVCRVVRGD